jgi:hypothetical protein
MPVQKLLPRVLNLDDDYLLVKPTEMVDALNIHVSDDKEGNAGVLKPSWGNEFVYFKAGDELPSGTNRVVGTTVNTQKGEVFFFVYNSNGDHSIYMYNDEIGQASLVYRDSVLSFTIDTFVSADCIVKENNETLLYFTDGVTEPKKINATKALLGGSYPYSSVGVDTYSDEEKLYSLTVCKAPPLDAPTFSFTKDENIKFSNLTNKMFQFASQYIYEDGEVSAISPYSELAINPLQSVDGYVDSIALEYYNRINVSVKANRGDVSKIRLLVRQAGSTTFYVVEEKDNNRAVDSISFVFENEKNYSIVPDYEVLKMYDNVPRQANALSIVNNRLVFGGYTEFYDNVDVVASKYPVYHSNGTISDVHAAPLTATNLTYNNVIVELAFGDLPRLTNATSNIMLNVKSGASYIKIVNPTGVVSLGQFGAFDTTSELRLGLPEFIINEPIALNPYTNFSNFASQITSAINKDYTVNIKPTQPTALQSALETHYFAGTITVNVTSTVDTANRKITLKLKINGADLYTSSGKDIDNIDIPSSNYLHFTMGIIDPTYTSTWMSYKVSNYISGTHFYSPSKTSFKAGVNHKFGVVFYDDRNRSGAVNEIGDVYVQHLAERAFGKVGPTEMVIRMVGSPPSWAKKWQLVYAPKSSYSFMYQYSVAEAFYSETTETDTNNRKLYLAMRPLEGKESSYTSSKGAKVDYSFVEGDIIRVIKYETGTLPNGENQYPSGLVFKVLGYNYQSTPDNPIVSSPHDEFRETGWFLEIQDDNISGWNAAAIDTGTDLWHHDTIIEIFRPFKQADTSVYYEIGEVNDVIYDSNTSTYRYGGDRDYTYTWASEYGNITVSGGIGTSSLDLREGDLINISSIDNTYSSVRIRNVIINPNGVEFTMDDVVSGSYALASILNLTDGVIQTFNGDVYYRPRQIKMNPNGDKTNKTGVYYETFFVEDNSVSDFIFSESNSSGRTNAASNSVSEIYRSSDVTYSDPYALDSAILSLSSFNLSNANFASLNPSNGAIRNLISGNDSITILQERKVSIVPVGKNVIQYADGNSGLAISNEFIGPQSFYAGDYGVNNNPESVVSKFGRIYFADIRQGKILRLSNDGIEPISEHGIDSFITSKCSEVVSQGEGNFRITGGYDPAHKEYIVSFEKYKGGGSFTNETIAFDVKSSLWNTRYSFVPEAYVDLNGFMYTFKNSTGYLMWRHKEEAVTSAYYSVVYPAKFSVVSNENASSVKSFKSLSIESKTPFSFIVSTDTNTTSMVSSSTLSDTTTPEYDASGNVIGYGYAHNKEGIVYAEIPKGINQLVNSAIVLGEVDSVSGDIVTFTSNIHDVPFQIGDPLFKVLPSGYSSMSLSPISIVDYNKIQFSGNVIANAGDIFVVESTSSVDGNPMRGRWAKIEFSQPTEDFEVYGVNVNYNESKLHFS